MYPLNIREVELKNRVALDFFNAKCFNHTKILGAVDFCIAYSDKSLFESFNFLWAEAKKGKNADIIESFAQLILTIGKQKTHDKTPTPLFLGAFDCEKIAFIEWHDIMGVFSQNDFNWLTRPSDYESKEFKQLYAQNEKLINEKKLLFYFAKDSQNLKHFIAQNFTLSNPHIAKIQITKNNFVSIYHKWLERVKPSISLDFEAKSQRF